MNGMALKLAPKFPGGRLEILPVCLARSNVNNQGMRFLDDFTSMRKCRCSLEILYEPNTGVEKLLYQKEQPCYVTEFPDDGSANSIALQFSSPFSVDEILLLVLTAEYGGFVPAPANRYQVRFHFAILDQDKWLPMNLHQLFGLDPSQWQPTVNLSHGLNPSLWARAYHPLASMAVGQDSATTLYPIRMEYEYGEVQELQSIQKWQFIAWDLRIQCWWTERVPSDPPSHKPMDGTPNLLESNNSSERIPFGTSMVNLQVPILKVPEPPLRPHLTARSSARNRACHTATKRRRSKRLESKYGVIEESNAKL
jgi:hypothetical protein